ncbi:hypothetical protein AAKU55_005490 [Oxalobacteraceae bacterium GrIS 1.11]
MALDNELSQAGGGTAGPKHERIALIAVHGVGTPAPASTVRTLVDLLQRGPGGAPEVRYSSFTETALDIPVSVVTLKSTRPDQADIAFSYDALGGVDPNEDARRYRTPRLTGTRTDCASGTETRIDAYEMYWADFSVTARTGPKFFGELYQLLFHLASLGRKTVLQALMASVAGEHASPGLLRLLAWVHQALAWLLPTTIPVANLFLLVPTLALAVLLIPAPALLPSAMLLLVALLFGAAILLCYRGNWRYAAPGVIALCGVAALIPNSLGLEQVRAWLMGAAMLFGLGLAWRASRGLLNRYSDAAIKWGPVAGVFVTVSVLAYFYHVYAGRDDLMVRVAASAMQVIFFILQVSWVAAAVLLMLACCLPFAGRRAGLDQAQRAAARTGRIGVLVSATLFYLTTALLWAWLLKSLSADIAQMRGVTLDCGLLKLYGGGTEPAFCSDESMKLSDLAAYLFSLTTGRFGNAFLILVGAALLLAVWGVLPSAWYESHPAPDSRKAGAGVAKRLWDWLDGSDAMLWGAELVLVAAWLVLGAGAFRPAPGDGNDGNWFLVIGGLLAAAMPLALLFRGQLPAALAAVLGIMLDVSNWLRERPFDNNPRGRILMRYIGLLQNEIAVGKYDRLVIVAHSQGTVITADTLRLLRDACVAPAGGMGLPPTALLTVGCPLVQLYAARFPQWYAWARAAGPAGLGIASWFNAYRSGDYVGRDLWRGGVDAAGEPGADHCDLGLGVGAHTHYFDRTAVEVGQLIDRLLATGTLAEPLIAPAARQAGHGGDWID